MIAQKGEFYPVEKNFKNMQEKIRAFKERAKLVRIPLRA
jgi:hypothetical protein